MSTSVPIDHGVARVAKDGQVAYLDEKSVPKKYLASIGMDVVEREVLPDGRNIQASDLGRRKTSRMIDSKTLDLPAMFTILLVTPHSIISKNNCLWLSDSLNIKGELPGN